MLVARGHQGVAAKKVPRERMARMGTVGTMGQLGEVAREGLLE